MEQPHSLKGIIVKANMIRRFRSLLLRAMKLAVLVAAAMACVVPLWSLWQAGAINGGTTSGLVGVVLFGAIAVPLVWAGLAFILIRRGFWRDRLIATSLLASAVVALGVACWALISSTIPDFGNPGTGVFYLTRHLLIILALSGASFFLAQLLRREDGPGAHACP